MNRISTFLIILLTILFKNSVNSQIIITSPILGFSQACASSSFNSYNLSFSFSPISNIQPDNIFIVEISDQFGSFTNAITLNTLTSTTSPVNVNFELPTNTLGEDYKLRVRSTNPISMSNHSVSFPAYYAIHNQPFSVNNNLPTVNFYEGNENILQVDTNTSSPLFYSYLSYKWYRNSSEIINQNGPFIYITQSGSYYATVDYGSCVMNSYSNIVEVNLIPNPDLSVNTFNSNYKKFIIRDNFLITNFNYNSIKIYDILGRLISNTNHIPVKNQIIIMEIDGSIFKTVNISPLK
jgi:hypothetical protein